MSLFTNSRFLKKEDVGTGIVATISHVVEEDIGRDEAPEKGNFHEANIKPIVLKPTNANLIAEITNVWDEPTIMAGGWNGFQILLVNDMSVTFNGKRGGLRARPVPQAAPAIPQDLAWAEWFPTSPLNGHRQPRRGPQEARHAPRALRDSHRGPNPVRLLLRPMIRICRRPIRAWTLIRATMPVVLSRLIGPVRALTDPFA